MGTTDIYPLIGGLIKSRRKRLSITQDRLAAALHISRASLANIEAGRQKILVHHLYAFADALQLSVKDFLVEPPAVASQPGSDLPLPSDLDERQKLQVMKMFSRSAVGADVLVEIDKRDDR